MFSPLHFRLDLGSTQWVEVRWCVCVRACVREREREAYHFPSAYAKHDKDWNCSSALLCFCAVVLNEHRGIILNLTGLLIVKMICMYNGCWILRFLV